MRSSKEKAVGIRLEMEGTQKWKASGNEGHPEADGTELKEVCYSSISDVTNRVAFATLVGGWPVTSLVFYNGHL